MTCPENLQLTFNDSCLFYASIFNKKQFLDKANHVTVFPPPHTRPEHPHSQLPHVLPLFCRLSLASQQELQDPVKSICCVQGFSWSMAKLQLYSCGLVRVIILVQPITGQYSD